jgi:hypothetical protein
MGLQETKIQSLPFAVMDHLRTTFAAAWKFEPDHDTSRVVPLGSDLTYICAPTQPSEPPGHRISFSSTSSQFVQQWAGEFRLSCQFRRNSYKA